MKKRFSLILCCVFVFSLCACGASRKKEFSLKAFSAEVICKTQQMTVEGTLCYTSPTDIRLTLKKPDTLCGLTAALSDSSITLSNGQTHIPLSSAAGLTGKDSLLENLFEALGTLGNTTFEIAESGKSSVSCDYAYGTLKAVIDGESETVSSLECEEFLFVFSYG